MTFFARQTDSNIDAMSALPLFRTLLETTVILFFFTFPGVAQTAPTSCQAQPPQSSTAPDGSIAAAAKSAKIEKSTHAKKVFTDEDMESIVETKASSILQFIHGLRGELQVTCCSGLCPAEGSGMPTEPPA